MFHLPSVSIYDTSVYCASIMRYGKCKYIHSTAILSIQDTVCSKAAVVVDRDGETAVGQGRQVAGAVGGG